MNTRNPLPGDRLLRLVAGLVPLDRRETWLAEWHAELAHARLAGVGAMRLRARCLGALPDALSLRRMDATSRISFSMLATDLRFAARSLLRRPVFTLIVVSTLALCIGATTSVFSVVQSVLLNGLAYRRLDRLVAVWSNNQRDKNDHYQVSVGDYMDWRARSRSFAQLAGYFPTWNALYGGADGVERIDVGAVSANFLPTLGVAPRLGRGFVDGEDRPGSAGAVVLSYAFWTSHFQSDTRVIGRSITLDGRPFVVVGVMGEDFAFPQAKIDLLMPLSVLGNYLDRREVHLLSVVGRLKDGVSLDAARKEMALVGAQVTAEHPKDDADLGVTVRPLADDLLGDVRRPITILFAAVCAVLLVGCANVTNLMLARAWSRREELAVRTALGARPAAIAQQVLVESALVAGVSGALGVWVAFVATRVLARSLPASIARIGEPHIDVRVIAFTLAVSVLVTLVCGVVPAIRAAHGATRGTLAGGRASGDRRGRRLYRGLVVAELSLALVLVVCAGLLLNSFARLAAVNPGFRRDGVLRMKVSLPSQAYPRAARDRFYETLIAGVRRIPGVRAAGLINRFPLHDGNVTTSVVVDGEPATNNPPAADLRQAGVGYFAAMGIPLVAGRDFGPQETPDSTSMPALIVNQSAVAKIFHGLNPIGRKVTLGSGTGPAITVVGVVGDVRDASLRMPATPQVFLSARQAPPSATNIVVRFDGAEAGPLVASIRGLVHDLDRTVPVFDAQTVRDVLNQASVSDRFTTLVLSGFSGLALLLASLGAYGVMAFGVTERTREIGVRMALGAHARDVQAMILREGLGLLALSLPIALVGAVAASRVLRGLLFEVAPSDPATVACAALTLCAATALASWLPARRAARIEPTTALRL